ncbi:ABC transporter substrate-binding protein (plasmid) [Agrobacterium tumefaciens]|uniref:ABC transporter substrate-binding protein n=1 Tax=Agrobacterium tumefaciens TaxID=358 RepID=UPI001572FD62|nr:ABC transporter substrate-binding protein [Agrobacterium tumefaciens]NSZ66141.1 ABC transporter substrate-binding protein [Agrobacterium tumefaciens]NTA72512.1 ABC transporter substrate-binding protein [Agrobacterium tumefaciens]WIE41753.1 ABC transporter substrate-binding protein [Agrobacterium tumefaciens]
MSRLVSATLAFSLLTASALSATPAFAGKADDTLVAAFAAQLPSLDRFYAPGREGFLLGLLIYDTLIYRDTQTFELKPLLATDWKWLDEKTLELHLRKGVTFHNGDAFTAKDVAYSFTFAADPKNKVFDRITSSWVDKVEVIDDYTVRFHASKVTPLALQYIVQVPMMPAAFRENVGLQAFSEQPVGTGPYKVTGKRGSDITFERFDNYFDGGPKTKPGIKTLVYRTIPDVNTQVAELARGGVDWAWYVPTDQAKRLEVMPTVKVVNSPTFRIGFLTLDAAGLALPGGPLTELKVRQAINHAIDRHAIAKTLIGGSAETIRTACNPSQFGCEQNVKDYAYDPTKAKQLLSEAGRGDGFDIDIYAFRSRPVAEAIVGYLGAVGIRANLVWQQYSAVVQQRRDRKAALVIDDFGSSGIADAGAPTKFYFNGAPDDQSRDAEVDAALDKAGSTNDADIRKQAFSVAFKRIADQAYWAPLFTMPINYVMSAEMEGPVPKDENVEFWKYHWK